MHTVCIFADCHDALMLWIDGMMMVVVMVLVMAMVMITAVVMVVVVVVMMVVMVMVMVVIIASVWLCKVDHASGQAQIAVCVPQGRHHADVYCC
jgi:hypothetical protein